MSHSWTHVSENVLGISSSSPNTPQNPWVIDPKSCQARSLVWFCRHWGSFLLLQGLVVWVPFPHRERWLARLCWRLRHPVGILGFLWRAGIHAASLFPGVLWLAVPSRNFCTDTGSGALCSAQHSGGVKCLGHGGQDPTPTWTLGPDSPCIHCPGGARGVAELSEVLALPGAHLQL